MLVSDLDMLKQIMIKDFDNFTDRLVCSCDQTTFLHLDGKLWLHFMLRFWAMLIADDKLLNKQCYPFIHQ